MMNRPTDILMLAEQSDQTANLNFLLRLSNFHTINIADDIEAFNYLVHRQNSTQPISLLLIADADVNQPIMHLLDDLEHRDALLPILLLRSNGPIPLDQLSSNVKVKTFIRQCDPSVAHPCIKEMLELFAAPQSGLPETGFKKEFPHAS